MNFTKELEELNHPLIPKHGENIKGEDLENYIQKTGDLDFAYAVLEYINNLLLQLAKIKNNDLRLSAKINSKNILIRDGAPYFVDQIEWVHSHEVFKIIMSTNVDICNSLHTSLLLYESVNWKTAAYDKNHAAIYTAQHQKNEEIFEKGVRHGFWNVKTKEEIKEKYEKYKHLEDWYES
tara:strand:- start:3285 stop:3821 length:537 start_codon:yes stop_codon:yes gene_type:complete